MKMRAFLIVAVAALQSLWAQDQPFLTLGGLLVYGGTNPSSLPVIVRADPGESQSNRIPSFITIEFDVNTPTPPDLQIHFVHCDRNWNTDNNIFLVDEQANSTNVFEYSQSPAGVLTFTYHYKNHYPDSRGLIAFTNAGNWIFTITDQGGSGRVLATGRLIIVDSQCRVSLSDRSVTDPDLTSPWNQVTSLSAVVQVPKSLSAQNVTCVDIYRDMRVGDFRRIDADNPTSKTFVDGITQSTKTFTIRDLPAGNEYRVLDISNVGVYPNGFEIVPRGGPDQTRVYWQGHRSLNGGSRYTMGPGGTEDYMKVDFRLSPQSMPSGNVYLAGAFNQWTPNSADKLEYDATEQWFHVSKWLRRGVYDYQYVLGSDNGDGTVGSLDWLSLEGNDWRTVSIFTVVVWYRDQQYGGFDRIVGFGRISSPGKPAW